MKKTYFDEYEKKAEELVAAMTVEEKAFQLSSDAPAIPRLGISSYHWWNEGLHGVARAGIATVFPQAIGLAATFDRKSLALVGKITATEGRIKYNAAQDSGDHGIYKGLTFWSPNINIYRDPRWGRGQETYGEDPFLTAALAESYITALQEGEDERYLHAAACVKHFAVHSGPEGVRHGFDSEVSDFDLHDTYLPAFAWCVRRTGVVGAMGAYNSINGTPCCVHREMIEDLLRKEWGFSGYFVSDCGALADLHEAFHLTPSAVESAALALNAGCDLNCGQVYLHVMEAYRAGLITEETIGRAVGRLMATRLKLGMFDSTCRYNEERDLSLVDGEEHRKINYEIAAKTLVLLKNNGVLPLDRKTLGTIGVIGPNADSIRALEGNYNGTASCYRTVLSGIREAAGEDVRVLYSQGCHLWQREGGDALMAEAMAVAEESDVLILCMGLDSSIEGEQGDASNEYGAGDKETLAFPGRQKELMENLRALGKPVVLVVLAGGALDLAFADQELDAILYGWYPGAEGGHAIADTLFGDRNPSGRTPVTFYRSLEKLPAFEDYSMAGRTYRYMEGKALYPFGYGLSYTRFSHTEPVIVR